MGIAIEGVPLLRLLRQSSERFDASLLGVALLSGLANAFLLAIINDAAANAANDRANGRDLSLYALAILVYLYAQRHLLLTSIVEVERILHDIRVRLTDAIRRADLSSLEGVGRADIYASLNQETVAISQAVPTLVIGGQAATMVGFSVIYLLYLSTAAFVLAFVITWIAVGALLRQAEEMNRDFHASTAKEGEFYDAVTHLLDGFKEVKMSEPRAADLGTHLAEIAGEVEVVKTRSGTSFARHFLFAQAAFYVLIASIVFLLPRVSVAYSEVVMQATAAILFIVGPLGGILNSIPVFTRANVSAANITRLDATLAAAAEDAPGAPTPLARGFTSLALAGVTYHYPPIGDDPPFGVGPLDLRLEAGETLFIVGGNGSGKSTLLKILTGLYHPQAGSIRMDGRVLDRASGPWYRSHFGVIFSDYHLFDRLYGLRGVDPRRVESLIALMELEKKTAYTDGRFSHTDLSSGQKKRLALVAALLEERPILVLDEWAADQDPQFRRYFYEELLPAQKRQGRTIVAVTHDERYFRVADRVLKMEYGQFVPHEGA